MKEICSNLKNEILFFLLYLDKEAAHFINIVFFVICLTAGPLIGSAVSICVIGGIVFGIWHLAKKNAILPKSKQVILCAIAFSSFFSAEAISASLDFSLGNFAEVIENLPFLGILPLYAVVFVRREILLKYVEIFSGGSAIVSYVFIIPNQLVYAQRAELFSGNPGVLGLLALVLLSINCASALRGNRVSWFPALGAIACVGLILSTGMRGLMPGIIGVPVIILMVLGIRAFRGKFTSIFIGACFALVFIGVLAADQIERRFAMTRVEIAMISENNYESSLGQRLLLWRAGYEIFRISPFTGAGPKSAQNLLTTETKELSGLTVSYSHFHNFVINTLARSGLLGLIAILSVFIVPFVVCRIAPKDEIGLSGFAILCGVQLSYLLSGLTGIMFGHDILDTVYIAVVVFTLYLIFSPRNDESEIVPDVQPLGRVV